MCNVYNIIFDYYFMYVHYIKYRQLQFDYTEIYYFSKGRWLYVKIKVRDNLMLYPFNRNILGIIHKYMVLENTDLYTHDNRPITSLIAYKDYIDNKFP